MKKSISLLVLLLLFNVYLKAQTIQSTQDFGIWMGLKLEKKLPKNFEIFLEQQLRTWDNTTRIDKYWAETGVNYSINKNFKLNGNLRYIYNTNKRQRPETRIRYNLGIEFGLKLNKKFHFLFRAQYQYKSKSIYNKGTYSLKSISNTRYRVKLKFKHNKNHFKWNNLRATSWSNAKIEALLEPHFEYLTKNGIIELENACWGTTVDLDQERIFIRNWMTDNFNRLDLHISTL